MQKGHELVAVVVAAEKQSVGIAGKEGDRMLGIALQGDASRAGGQVCVKVGVAVEKLVDSTAGNDRAARIDRRIDFGFWR